MPIVLSGDTVKSLAPEYSGSTLIVVDKGLTNVGDLGAIGSSLRKLDVSNNELNSLAGLRGPLITWFSANNNRLRNQALVEINSLPELAFVGLSNNQISAIPVSALSAQAHSLRALLLNGNKLVRLEHLGHLLALTTLVCSHNRLEDVSSVCSLKLLQKLSAGHNRLNSIPASFGSLLRLAELRLNDNALNSLPPELASCQGLRLIDLGNNLFPDFESVAPLAKLRRLVNLTLRGNPLAPAAFSDSLHITSYVSPLRRLCANICTSLTTAVLSTPSKFLPFAAVATIILHREGGKL